MRESPIYITQQESEIYSFQNYSLMLKTRPNSPVISDTIFLSTYSGIIFNFLENSVQLLKSIDWTKPPLWTKWKQSKKKKQTIRKRSWRFSLIEGYARRTVTSLYRFLHNLFLSCLIALGEQYTQFPVFISATSWVLTVCMGSDIYIAIKRILKLTHWWCAYRVRFVIILKFVYARELIKIYLIKMCGMLKAVIKVKLSILLEAS